MKNIRAKFLVNNVTDQHDGQGEKLGENVNMSPVYSPDPTTENYSFSKATPGGIITLYISNPDAWGTFENGQEVYVDFSAVE